ncbi:hypothetical protein [Helicobacter jaachi]|uniref:hypothetical protein n=1 Tax=Helicobacter jaachi TaxID=1677920 RepID=UPI0005129C1A|nr:hypothetical protein [Helicobacter jaachi]
MKLFKRKNYLAWHLYISLFFIPMALMYKITGIVGILGYFGDNKVYEVALSSAQKAALTEIIESSKIDSINATTASTAAKQNSDFIESTTESTGAQESKNTQKANLQEIKLQEPSGFDVERLKNQFIKFLIDNEIKLPASTNFQKARHKNGYTLGSPAYRIELELNNPPKVKLYTNDWLGNLVALHFARAGVAFNVLAFSFVVFMFITYVTGLLMCDFKKNGKKYFLAMFVGLLVTTTLGVYGLYF